MEECRLGYNALHVIQSPPEGISSDYVVVQYTCPCGEIIRQFALHHVILCHLMGRPGRVLVDPRTRPYLQLLNTLQTEAMLAAHSATDEDEDENEDEESPNR